MENKNSSTPIFSTGSILAVTQIVFLVLRTTEIINWSWWLIFIPAYIMAGLVIMSMCCLIITCIFVTALEVAVELEDENEKTPNNKPKGDCM